MAISKRIPLVVAVLCGLTVAGLTADQRGRAGRNRPAANQAPRQGDLKPGDLAPDFTLQPVGEGPPITLSSFRNRQPVALVFGSYT